MDWKRIMALVKRTGDRVVVVDPDYDEPVVIMPLSSFEEALEEEEEWADALMCERTHEVGDELLSDDSLTMIREHEHELTDTDMMMRETIDNSESSFDRENDDNWYIEPVPGEE